MVAMELVKSRKTREPDPELTRAILSFDSISGIYSVEAIEPGGISRSRALGFLEGIVETSDAPLHDEVAADNEAIPFNPAHICLALTISLTITREWTPPECHDGRE